VVFIAEKVSSDEAVTDSLRALVREELNNRGTATLGKKSQELRPRQFIFLLAFALDITLLYLWVAELNEANKLWDSLEKLLPALGGTLAVSYFDRLREWLFAQSEKAWLRKALWVPPLVFLVLIRLPIYSLVIQLYPASAELAVTEADTGKPVGSGSMNCTDGKTCKIPGLKFYPYRLKVKDGNFYGLYEISRLEVLKGTFARLPVLREFFAPRPLWVLYEFPMEYKDPAGVLYIYSLDPTLPLKQLSTGLRSSSTEKSSIGCPTNGSCWQKTIERQDETLSLPIGSYVLTQVNGESCLQLERDVSETRQDRKVYLLPSSTGVWNCTGL
jgi:hypothetical protein